MNIEKIKKIMEEKNITLYRLSKITDLNESNLGKIISGKTKDPRISYVKAIPSFLITFTTLSGLNSRPKFSSVA